MRWIGTLAASLAVLVAACSRREADVEAEPASEESSVSLSESLIAEGVNVVQATLTEWKVALSQDSIPAGTVAFMVHNGGTVEHALELEATGDGGEWQTDALAAGGSVTMSLNLEPGVYEVYCPVNADGTNHPQSGMRTRLRVY
jgi:hypothetical protein